MSDEKQAVKQQQKMGFTMVVGMWVLLLSLLMFFFGAWFDEQNNPNQRVSSAQTAEGVREVVLTRNRYGHYVANGSIDGHSVVFMVDTGASDIAVPGRLAAKLNLEKGPQQIYQTANGPSVAYMTTLDHVALGNIELDTVRASINPNMSGDEILLGMSFLKGLEFSQRGDQLTIRQQP